MNTREFAEEVIQPSFPTLWGVCSALSDQGGRSGCVELSLCGLESSPADNAFEEVCEGLAITAVSQALEARFGMAFTLLEPDRVVAIAPVQNLERELLSQESTLGDRDVFLDVKAQELADTLPLGFGLLGLLGTQLRAERRVLVTRSLKSIQPGACREVIRLLSNRLHRLILERPFHMRLAFQHPDLLIACSADAGDPPPDFQKLVTPTAQVLRWSGDPADETG